MNGQLSLHYRREGERTLAHDRHHGPLRVLQRLYPEGPAICHHVLVHPPGGMVGGDQLTIDLHMDADTHAVVTTPGAARFYRSAGAAATQTVQLALEPGARLEWLPLETLAYSGCRGQNRLQMRLAPGAALLGWDMLALGLPAAGQDFERGSFLQHLAWPGVWLERGHIAADDLALRDGAAGLAGRSVLATMWFASGTAWTSALQDSLLAAAREAVAARAVLDKAAPNAARHTVVAGATAPDARLLLLRVLGWRVESVQGLLLDVRAAWRRIAWDLDAAPPRIWRT